MWNYQVWTSKNSSFKTQEFCSTYLQEVIWGCFTNSVLPYILSPLLNKAVQNLRNMSHFLAKIHSGWKEIPQGIDYASTPPNFEPRKLTKIRCTMSFLLTGKCTWIDVEKGVISRQLFHPTNVNHFISFYIVKSQPWPILP